MKCPNCYCDVKENDIFCKNCGHELNTSEKSVVNFNTPSYKRRNSHPWLIVGAILFVMLAAFIGIIIFCIKYDEDHPREVNTSGQTVDRRKKEKVNQVDFSGYTFNIPSQYKNDISGDKLFIYDKNNDWVAVVIMKQIKYDVIAESKDQLQTLLANQSGAEKYDMSSAVTEEKEYGGKKFLITKNIKSGSYYLDISYGKADENDLYIISVTKSDGSELTSTERSTVYSIVADSKKGV